MRAHLFCGVLCVALVAAAPGRLALAQTESDGGKVDAKALIQSGVKLLKQKDYLGALAVFRDAYQRFPSVNLLLNIGTTLKLLGRNAEAANTYQQYLDDPQASPARRAEVSDVLATLDRVLGRVAIALEEGGPADAEVSINGGEWIALAPRALIRVDPGEVTVAVRRQGFAPFETKARVAAAEELPISVALSAVVAPAPEVGSGDLMVPEGGAAPSVTKAAAPAARSRLGLMIRGHFHLSPAGAAALVGPTVDLTARAEVNAGVLLGRFRGGYVGGSYAILPGRVRPLASAGVLLVADDGLRVAARAALGVELVVNRNVSVFAEAGGEHLFNAPMDVLPTVFVPSAGVFGRL